MLCQKDLTWFNVEAGPAVSMSRGTFAYRIVALIALQRWAKRLELQVRRYPMQWHNFYNYWER